MNLMKQAASIFLTASILFTSAQPWAAAGSTSSGGNRGTSGETARSGAEAVRGAQSTDGFSYTLEPQVEKVGSLGLDASAIQEALGRQDGPVLMGEAGAGRTGIAESIMRPTQNGERTGDVNGLSAWSDSDAFGAPRRATNVLSADRLDRLFGERERNIGAAAGASGTSDGDNFKPNDAAPEEAKEFMDEDVDLNKALNHQNYAPGSKKARNFGWSLRAAAEAAKRSIAIATTMRLRDYWKIHKRFWDSTKDYHVASTYFSTEVSVLGFTVAPSMGEDGKLHYYITYIDRTKLSEDSFPFHEYDELVSFNGKPAHEAVEELRRETMVENKLKTDRGLSSLYLTLRRGARGLDVPQEAFDVVVRKKGQSGTESRQVIWDYTPETVDYSLTRLRGLRTNGFGARGEEFLQTTEFSLWTMLSPIVTAFTDAATGKNYLEGNPHGLGNRESYLPNLGPIEQDLSTPNFHAYIYKNAEGKKVGYVRIANYTPKDAEAALDEFAGIVQKLEAGAEGLVIDQLNNPGGSVFYLYALASMLTPNALATPKHQILLNPQQVAQAQKLLDLAPRITNDTMARMALGPTFGGYPVSYQLFKFLEKWAMDVVAQWKKGNALTEELHMYGVDKINPSTKARFTKPIVILVNELDFSGGDFFPFIMAAMNKRAKLFGTETAGAGGFVVEMKYPNLLGIDSIHLTGSTTVVENNSGPISYPYEVTTKDMENNFHPMVDAVNASMSAELRAATPAPTPAPSDHPSTAATPQDFRRVAVPGGPAPVSEVSDQTKSAIEKVFSGLKADGFAEIEWNTGVLIGRYVSFSLGKDEAGNEYEAAIRVGQIGPNEPVQDPNTVGRFWIRKTDISTKKRTHSSRSISWTGEAPRAGRPSATTMPEAMKIADFDMDHPVRVGNISWNEDTSGPADGMRGAIRFTFLDSKGNTLQLQLPQPGIGEVGGRPVFKFIPPNLDEAHEDQMKDYPITRENVDQAMVLFLELLTQVSNRDSVDPALADRVVREIARRMRLIKTTEPQPESFPVEGGLMRGLMNITPERAKAVWAKVQAERSVPPARARLRQLYTDRTPAQPTSDERAALRSMPRFTVNGAAPDEKYEVYVKDDHTAIFEQWSPNPNWDKFFEIPLD